MTTERRRTILRLATLAALAIPLLVPLFGPSAAQAADAPKGPSLAGTWKLDDDLTARLRLSERGEGGSRFRFGAGSGPGVGGGGVHRPDAPSRGGRPGWRGEGAPEGGEGESPGGGFRAAMAQLTIAVGGQPATVTLTDATGRERALTPDRRKVRDETAPGGPVTLRAEWLDDGTLAVTVSPDKGPKRTETYAVSNDRTHLFVTFTIDRGGREMKHIWAYDAAGAAAQAPSG